MRLSAPTKCLFALLWLAGSTSCEYRDAELNRTDRNYAICSLLPILLEPDATADDRNKYFEDRPGPARASPEKRTAIFLYCCHARKGCTYSY
jgi:hypothetical protein